MRVQWYRAVDFDSGGHEIDTEVVQLYIGRKHTGVGPARSGERLPVSGHATQFCESKDGASLRRMALKNPSPTRPCE